MIQLFPVKNFLKVRNKKNIFKLKNVFICSLKIIGKMLESILLTPLFFLNEKSSSLEDQVFIFLLKIKEDFPH